MPPSIISKNAQRGELIALAEADAKGNTMTIQVLRAGEFTDMHGKDFTLTSRDLDEYISNSNAVLAKEEIPVEIGHPQDEDGAAPAAAWYRRFFKKVVDGVEWICAEIELSALGSQSLEDKLYKYFSAVLYTDTREIAGGGFVNRPAVSGQQVVGSLAAFMKPKERQVKKNSLAQSVTAVVKRVLGIVELEMAQEDIQQAVWEALRTKYGDPLDEYGGHVPWLVKTYAEHVIVQQDGKYFDVTYTIDAEGNVTLGEPVEAEMTWTIKQQSSTAALAAKKNETSPKGGESQMTDEEMKAKIEAARKEERETALPAVRDADARIEAARKEEREKVLVEQKRQGDIAELAAKLTTGARAFADKPEDLAALLGKLTDDDRALITPLLERIHQNGLVDLGERGTTNAGTQLKALDAGQKMALARHLQGGGKLDKFLAANQISADEYDISEFVPAPAGK